MPNDKLYILISRSARISLAVLLLSGLVVGAMLSGMSLFQPAVQEAQAVDQGDGRIIYGEGTVTTPRARIWTSSTQSWEDPESSINAAAATIRHVVVKSAPTRDETLVGIQTTGGTLYVQRWNGSSWSSEWNITVGDGNLPRFDIAYEKTSGEALVVYGTNAGATNEIAYRRWTGSGWVGPTNYDAVRTSGIVQGLAMVTTSSTDDIAMVWADANLDLSANYWNGTSNAWQSEPSAALSTGVDTLAAAASLTTWSFDLEFESISGELLIAWGNAATADITYVTRGAGAAGTWGSVTTNTTFAEQSDDLELSADPNSNNIILVHTGSDSGNDLEAAVWTGSAFPTTIDTAIPCSASVICTIDASVDTTGAGTSGNAAGWLTSGAATRGIVVYDDANAAGLDWARWDATNGWALQTDCTTACNSQPASGDDKLHRIRMNPFNEAELMWIGVDLNSDLFAKKLVFDGTNLTWFSTEPSSAALEAAMSSITGLAADFAFNRFIPVTTTIGPGTDPASATAAPESGIRDGGAFTLQTSAGIDSVTAATATLALSGTPYQGLSEVRITSNDGATTYFTAISNPSSNTLSFSGGTPIPASTTQTQFKIRVTPKTHAAMSSPPGAEYDLSPFISALTSANAQAGSDTNANILTIDNLSPANVTDATTSPGDSQMTVFWTNPADGDFSNLLIVRATSSSVTGTPTEGTSPAINDPIGNGIVRYISSGTSFLDPGLANGTTYFYRIFAKDTRGNYSVTGVEASGTPAAVVTVSQEQFRWYQNTNGITPATALAALNATATDIAKEPPIRLRMNIKASGATLVSGQVYKLQYSTSTVGGWIDVGVINSGVTWRGADNTSVDDGVILATTTLSSSTVLESYEEENNATATPNAIPNGGFGEFDWTIEDWDAQASTTYYFRMAKSDNNPLDSYSRYPTLITVGQAEWHAPEDVATSSPKDEILRLRIELANTSVATSGAYRIEYASKSGTCASSTAWTAVPALATTEHFEMATTTYYRDGASTTARLANSESYGFIPGRTIEYPSNQATTTTLAPSQYSELEYAFFANANSVNGETYCFRLTDSGAPLTIYSSYPEITIIAPPAVLTQQDYRWYVNQASSSPGAALTAGENQTFSGATSTSVYRLRMNVKATTAALTVGNTFKLQYSTATSSGWTDVGTLTSSTIWRGVDNTGVADGETLMLPLKLVSSTIAESYEEENDSVGTPNTIPVNNLGEWDWVIQNNGATASTTYYFRMIKSDGADFAAGGGGYINYPTVMTATSTLGIVNLTQIRYRWRNDDENEINGTWAAGENISISGLNKYASRRLRLQVSNEGSTSSLPVAYRLEYATSAAAASSSWKQVGTLTATSAHWVVYDSWRFLDGAQTTNVSGGLNDPPGKSFVAGQLKDTSVQTVGITLSSSSFTEVEFSVRATSTAIDSQTYFFRLTNAGADLDTYSIYASATLSATSPNLTQIHYRWRNDDGNEVAATWASSEDSFILIDKNSTKRLRIEISNRGNGASASVQYRLQFSTSTAGPWLDVSTSGAYAWNIVTSTYLEEGSSTTNVFGGLTDDNTTFVSGTQQETSNQTPGIILTETQFTEIEYVLRSTNNANGSTTYYFRLTDAGADLGVYARYAQANTSLYPAQGTIVSAVFDTVAPNGVGFNSLLWKGTKPVGSRVRIQLGTSNCANGAINPPACSSGTWTDVGIDCTASTYYEPNADTPAPIECFSIHNNQRYFRYKVNLCSANCTDPANVTPQVNDVIVNWSP